MRVYTIFKIQYLPSKRALPVVSVELSERRMIESDNYQ